MQTFFIVILLISLLALIVRNRVRIGRFLGKWNEFITIPVALILWASSSKLLLFVDPQAGTYDAGIFQKILFSFIGILFFHGFTCLLMRLRWPGLDAYLSKTFNLDLKTLTAWQISKLSVAVFFLLFYALVLLALSI